MLSDGFRTDRYTGILRLRDCPVLFSIETFELSMLFRRAGNGDRGIRLAQFFGRPSLSYRLSENPVLRRPVVDAISSVISSSVIRIPARSKLSGVSGVGNWSTPLLSTVSGLDDISVIFKLVSDSGESVELGCSPAAWPPANSTSSFDASLCNDARLLFCIIPKLRYPSSLISLPLSLILSALLFPNSVLSFTDVSTFVTFSKLSNVD